MKVTVPLFVMWVVFFAVMAWVLLDTPTSTGELTDNWLAGWSTLAGLDL